jgi:hypothetical protein
VPIKPTAKTLPPEGHTVSPGLGDTALRVEGSSQFREQLENALATIRGTHAGEVMLRRLDESDRRVVIREYHQDSHVERIDGVWESDGRFLQVLNHGPFAVPGSGVDAAVLWNASTDEIHGGSTGPDDKWKDTPPAVILFHELAHAHDMVYGTMQPIPAEMPLAGIYAGPPENTFDATDVYYGVHNFERDAVGLPQTGFLYEHPTEKVRWSPNRIGEGLLTENGFRRELGLLERPVYHKQDEPTPQDETGSS